jgi:PD-(D/E)XK nuclease superfamily protein
MGDVNAFLGIATAPAAPIRVMLGAVADLRNEFSWSRTRDNVFQECRRRYFFHYYGAWGGWDAGADPTTRALYVLKQLGTRQMWAGRLVHEAIERALLAVRDGFALSETSLIDDTVRQMREEWKGSRAGVYRETPKRTGLFEHEYGVPIKDAEWQALRDHVMRCMRNFHRLPLLGDIKRTPTERWIMIEDIGSFAFEGVTVFAAPDFGYWSEANRLQLVDWKTGGGGEDASLQLGGYALYALEMLHVDPARVDLLEVNLRESKVTSHPCDATALDRVREYIRLSMRSMRAYLKDAQRNLAEEANFEKTEDLRICRWCNFRAVCRPELPAFAAPQSAPAAAP